VLVVGGGWEMINFDCVRGVCFSNLKNYETEVKVCDLANCRKYEINVKVLA
jgi:hypothetical protein